MRSRRFRAWSGQHAVTNSRHRYCHSRVCGRSLCRVSGWFLTFPSRPRRGKKRNLLRPCWSVRPPSPRCAFALRPSFQPLFRPATVWASHPVSRPSLCFVSLPAALSSRRPSCPRICWFALTPAACGYPAPGTSHAPGSGHCLLWPVGRVRRSSPFARTVSQNRNNMSRGCCNSEKNFLSYFCRWEIGSVCGPALRCTGQRSPARELGDMDAPAFRQELNGMGMWAGKTAVPKGIGTKAAAGRPDASRLVRGQVNERPN